MSAGPITSLEMRIIEAVLEMGGGYVVDFSDRTFSEFFAEHGVAIDEPRYSEEGTSKARRLRHFLRNEEAPLTGRVLAGLLQHRLVSKSDTVSDANLAAYLEIVERLGGPIPRGLRKVVPAAAPEKATEADLLRLVFRPEVFGKLPVEPAMSAALVGRMKEAHRCVESGCNLAAVILCGSVLEGMCLGFGCRHPERVNRGYLKHYGQPPGQFPDWKLSQWIEVLTRLDNLSPNIGKFGHALREFRNYVHPAEQLANRFSPDEHTARISFQVVVAAAEDLVRAEGKRAAEAKS